MMGSDGTTPEVHEDLGAYAVDALDPVERARFERHLDTCASCQAHLPELHETAASLGTAMAVEPPGSLRKRVLDAQRTAVDHGRDGRTRRYSGRMLLLVAAGLVVVAAATGAVVWQLGSGARQTQQQLLAVQEVLSAPDAHVASQAVTGAGRMVVTWSAQQSRAVVVSAALPSLPSHLTYQLWAVAGRGATSLGLVAGAGGTSTTLVQLPPASAAVAMTAEPIGGSTKPTSTPLVVVPLTTG